MLWVGLGKSPGYRFGLFSFDLLGKEELLLPSSNIQCTHSSDTFTVIGEVDHTIPKEAQLEVFPMIEGRFQGC